MFRSIQILILLLVFCNSLLNAQNYIVDEYRDAISKEFVDICVNTENQIKEEKDSLTIGKLYAKLGRRAGIYSEKLSLKYEYIALGLFERLGYDSLYFRMKASMCYPNINLGNYDQAETDLLEALEFFTTEGNFKLSAEMAHKIGFLYKEKGEYVKSLEYLQKNYNIYVKKSGIGSMGGPTNLIGIVYAEIGDCETAIEFYERYLAIEHTVPARLRWKNSIMSNAADCYLKLGQDSIAKAYYEQSINKWTNSSSSKYKVLGFRRKSKFSQHFKQIEKAKYELDSAFYYARLFNNNKLLSELEYQKYHLYKDDVSAFEQIKILLNSIERASSSTNSDQLLLSHEALATIYLEQKNYSEFVIHDQISDSLKNRFYSKEVLNSLKGLAVQFNNEQTDDKIKLLESQNRLEQDNYNKERRLKNFLMLIVLFSILLIGLISYYFIQRSKTAKELKEKNSTISKALKINKVLMKEVHHRVKNNLQVVSSLLYLQSRFVKDDSALGAIKTGRARVQAMSILHQKLYQKENLQNVNIKNYFEDLCSNLMGTYKIDHKLVNLTVDVEDIELDVDTVIPLGLIVNELISNSLKHAFDKNQKGNISLVIKRIDHKILMQVKDDGKGLPFNKIPEKSDSLGMDLIKSFAEKLEAHLEILNDNGACIQLTFEPLIMTKTNQ